MRLSIIIPVYKAENYLSKCVDSILCQSFKDWELILIEDGSPDSSGRICDDYARMDKRIKVIHKQNEGVSVARNKGLEIATGDYVTFIDSDDSIEGDCFSPLYNTACDLMVFESISYASDGTRKYWYDINEGIIDTPEGVEGFIRNYINVFVLDGPCGKFFKRSVIGSIRFPEGQPLGEDNVFMLSFISCCSSIELKKGLYYVIDDHYNGNYNKYLMSAKKSLSCLENIIDAYKQLKLNIPAFEERMFHIFCMVRDPYSDYKCWFASPIVKDLEKKYLHLEARSTRLYYFTGRFWLTRNLGYCLYWKYLKMRNYLHK